MTRRLALIVGAALLVGLPTASASAAAIGIKSNHAVASPAHRAGSRLIAPATVCVGQDRLGAPASTQEAVMRCMTDFARRQAGLPELVDSNVLDQSAEDKSSDILSCDSFSHFACGREFTYWMRETGFLAAPCWRVGENLAWGTGDYGSVGSIFRALMRSPTHRENILGDYNQIGIDVRVGDLEDHVASHVWTQHFGSHCDDPQPESIP